MKRYELTERQKIVSELREQGATYREISERLGINANTVRTHYEKSVEKRQYSALIQDFINGATVFELERKYGYTIYTVENLVKPYKTKKALDEKELITS